MQIITDGAGRRQEKQGAMVAMSHGIQLPLVHCSAAAFSGMAPALHASARYPGSQRRDSSHTTGFHRRRSPCCTSASWVPLAELACYSSWLHYSLLLSLSLFLIEAI